MIRRVVDLVHELRDIRDVRDWIAAREAGIRVQPLARWHPRPQQETARGVVRAFLGVPCEFGRNCAYPGLGWRCGHRRAR